MVDTDAGTPKPITPEKALGILNQKGTTFNIPKDSDVLSSLIKVAEYGRDLLDQEKEIFNFFCDSNPQYFGEEAKTVPLTDDILNIYVDWRLELQDNLTQWLAFRIKTGQEMAPPETLSEGTNVYIRLVNITRKILADPGKFYKASELNNNPEGLQINYLDHAFRMVGFLLEEQQGNESPD